MNSLRQSRAYQGVVALFALVLSHLMSVMAWATDPLLPDTGVDLTTLIAEVVLTLGAAVTVIIAAYFAFKAIKVALRWVGMIGG